MAKTRRVSRRASKRVARSSKATRKSARRSKASKKSARRSKASRKSSSRSKKHSSAHISTFKSAKSHRSKAMKSTVHEYDTTDKHPMKMLRKKTQKRSSKSKGKSPYNLFVKKKFAAYKKEQPGLKAPEIMKKIAKEWKSRSAGVPEPEK